MEKLLLVEDHAIFGKMTRTILEKEFAWPVTWTQSLSETVALLEKSTDHFTAAVLDFDLPDAMKGEIIDAVVKEGIPSIIFTASIGDGIREYVWSKKVVDYIFKDDPNCLDYLVSSIRKLITNQEKIILLVDDSSFFRKALSDLLQVQQYQLITASTPAKALKALKNYPDIQLVLTDFNMPEMDGCQLCKVIRKTKKKDDLAIIGISAEGDKTMAARFLKSGANDFIVKQSFITEEFYCRINQCLENIDLIRQAKLAAISDFLTGLYNRRYFFEQGEVVFREAKKASLPLGCAMIDIDLFKQVNDTYGHGVGDQVLQALSKILKAFVKKNELLARLGGEEFCILVPADPKGVSDKSESVLDDLEARFNQLRSDIENTKFFHGERRQLLQITVSIGISHQTDQDFSHLLKTADQKLYEAKENGRNQVVLATDEYHQ